MKKTADSTIQVRVDASIKKKARNKFHKHGLTISAGVKMFLHEFVQNEEKFFSPIIFEEVNSDSLNEKAKKAYHQAKKTPKSGFVNM